MSSKVTQLKEERLKKFKGMGIPAPMAPVDPALLKNINADPEKLKKLDAIRNGLKKNEFIAFIGKSTPTKQFESVPTPKQRKNPNAPKAVDVPEIKAFSPDKSSSSEAELLEGAMYGETTSRPNPYSERVAEETSNQGYTPIPRIVQEESNDDPTGSRFIAEFKSRMRSTASSRPTEKIQVVERTQQRQSGLSITEEELNKKIVELATQVSKNMIKRVISESAKSGSGIILETDKVKKVEIVGNGVVKMNGKLYKLTPVKEQR